MRGEECRTIAHENYLKIDEVRKEMELILKQIKAKDKQILRVKQQMESIKQTCSLREESLYEQQRIKERYIDTLMQDL